MQSPCIDACKTLRSSNQQFASFFTHRRSLVSPSSSLTFFRAYPCVTCSFNGEGRNQQRNSSSGSGERVKVKGKDNVWSVDNEAANMERSRKGKKREKREKRVKKRTSGDNVLISGAMLIEVETVLQTQEPVIRPAWNTFASSVSGIWKGVGAVFSPITAEMDPIDVGTKNEKLFDCYIISHIEAAPSPSKGQTTQIQRRVNWVTLNPYGENGQSKEKNGGTIRDNVLPKFESFDFEKSDVMEEDVMCMEPGLVFFEDGSYSRGPVDIPVGEANESEYYLTPTLKFEQCLVKGCHKRLRIVHTIEFTNGGSDIQIMRVAVYEEEWASPSNLPDKSDTYFDLIPFSQRKRVQPSDLTGSWKVFEVSATPIYDDKSAADEIDGNGTPYVYLCTETLKKRNLPENPVFFGEEELLDMSNLTVLWLPGGVTAYVDVNEEGEGVLCVGVGWYSDEGINLVMERDYGIDGKLKDIRSKSEVKRRWDV